MALPDRKIETQRAYLPSDFGRAPARRTAIEDINAEREDPRRGRTAYVEALRREIVKRTLTDTLLEGYERRGLPGGDGNPPEPIDTDIVPCLNVFVQVNREEDEMSSATMSKPKKVSKISKKIVKAVKKTAKKIKAKKGRKAKGTTNEQTCLNLPLALKVKLYAAADKLGISRSEFMRNKLAEAVGFKIAS